VLTALIADELAQMRAGQPPSQVPSELVARHVASTFVLVLNWWIEREPALTPQDADACFRHLVSPALTRCFSQLV
jgi:hypothetical protein